MLFEAIDQMRNKIVVKGERKGRREVNCNWLFLSASKINSAKFPFSLCQGCRILVSSEVSAQNAFPRRSWRSRSLVLVAGFGAGCPGEGSLG